MRRVLEYSENRDDLEIEEVLLVDHWSNGEVCKDAHLDGEEKAARRWVTSKRDQRRTHQERCQGVRETRKIESPGLREEQNTKIVK